MKVPFLVVQYLFIISNWSSQPVVPHTTGTLLSIHNFILSTALFGVENKIATSDPLIFLSLVSWSIIFEIL